jgi:hypothetical protein
MAKLSPRGYVYLVLADLLAATRIRATSSSLVSTSALTIALPDDSL